MYNEDHVERGKIMNELELNIGDTVMLPNGTVVMVEETDNKGIYWGTDADGKEHEFTAENIDLLP